MQNLLMSMIMKRGFFFIGFFLFVTTGSSFAQESVDTMVFSLEEALRYAEDHAFESKQANYTVEEAEKKVKEFFALGLPQVNLEAQLTDNLSIQENVITMSPQDGSPPMILKTKFGQQYSWGATGQVRQLLFDGSYLLGVKAAKIYVAIQKQQQELTLVDIRKRVIEAYSLVLISCETQARFKKNLEVNEQILKEAQSFYESGFRELTDVDQLRLMVNKTKNMLLESERQFQIAEAVLKYAMGVKLEQPIVLVDSLSDLLLPVEDLLVSSGSFDVKQHLSYSLLETQEQAQFTLLKNERAEYFPKLNAFYSYNYLEFGDKFSQMERTNSQMLGLSLTMPIFTSGRQRAKVQQAKINYLKTQNEMLQMEESLKQQCLVSEANFNNAQASLKNNKEAEAIALRVYERTQIKFLKGMSSSLELSQNEEQYIQAQMSLIQSTLNMIEAYVDYQKARDRL